MLLSTEMFIVISGTITAYHPVQSPGLTTCHLMSYSLKQIVYPAAYFVRCSLFTRYKTL